MDLTATELASYMDHTLLKPDAQAQDIDAVVQQAIEYHCASVCVNGYWVTRVASALKDSGVKTCAVIGFPLGAMSTQAKVWETTDAVRAGAQEIDMVINVGELKAGNDKAVQRDIAEVAAACHEGQALLKVIIECCLLSNDEKRRACELAVAAQADFVKTSTGFSTHGATIDDVQLMRTCVGDACGVKAAGGIKTLSCALAMIDAGANRLGVSAAPAILAEVNA